MKTADMAQVWLLICVDVDHLVMCGKMAVYIFDGDFDEIIDYVDQQLFEEITTFEEKLKDSDLTVPRELEEYKTRASVVIARKRKHPKSESKFKKEYPVFASFYFASLHHRTFRPNIRLLCESFLFLSLIKKIKATQSDIDSVAMLAHMSVNVQPQNPERQINNIEAILPSLLTKAGVTAAINKLAKSQPTKFDDNRAREARVALSKLLDFLERNGPPCKKTKRLPNKKNI